MKDWDIIGIFLTIFVLGFIAGMIVEGYVVLNQIT